METSNKTNKSLLANQLPASSLVNKPDTFLNESVALQIAKPEEIHSLETYKKKLTTSLNLWQHKLPTITNDSIRQSLKTLIGQAQNQQTIFESWQRGYYPALPKFLVALKESNTKQKQGNLSELSSQINTSFPIAVNSVLGGGNNNIFEGGNGSDLIFGTNSNDTIYGANGNDSLYGKDGDDWLIGEQGHDWLYGEKGNDFLSGGNGNDFLWGGDDNDGLAGGQGDDTLFGERGNDFLIGGRGNDQLMGDMGRDVAFFEGNIGNYNISGNRSLTSVSGIDGNDTLSNVEILVFDTRVTLAKPVLSVSGFLDVEYYLAQNLDVAAAVAQGWLSAEAHFNSYGQYEGRDPNPLFDTQYYLAQNPDVAAAVAQGWISASAHYLLYGGFEGRNPSKYFNSAAYFADYADIANAWVNPLQHFLKYGANEGRTAQLTSQGTEEKQQYLALSNEQPMGEIGRLTNLTHESRTIYLNRTYINPVVFALVLSANDAAPAAVRLSSVQSDRFTLAVQEPEYLDNRHGAESVSYLVLEAGTWKLANGTLLQVGNFKTNKLVTQTQGWNSITFNSGFTAAPVVFSQVQSKNGSDFVRTRQQQTTTTGFQVGMEEEEALAYSGHYNETLGWFAIEPGQGNWSGRTYQVAQTANTVTDQWTTLSLGSNFSETPNFWASLATYNDSDSAGLRYQSLSNSQVQVCAQEEISLDLETQHGAEAVSFLALAGTGSLTASRFVQPAAASQIATSSKDLLTGGAGVNLLGGEAANGSNLNAARETNLAINPQPLSQSFEPLLESGLFSGQSNGDGWGTPSESLSAQTAILSALTNASSLHI